MRKLPVGRQLLNYRQTGFEEIGARAAFRRTIFPPTGLELSRPTASFKRSSGKPESGLGGIGGHSETTTSIALYRWQQLAGCSAPLGDRAPTVTRSIAPVYVSPSVLP